MNFRKVRTKMSWKWWSLNLVKQANGSSYTPSNPPSGPSYHVHVGHFWTRKSPAATNCMEWNIIGITTLLIPLKYYILSGFPWYIVFQSQENVVLKQKGKCNWQRIKPKIREKRSTQATPTSSGVRRPFSTNFDSFNKGVRYSRAEWKIFIQSQKENEV